MTTGKFSIDLHPAVVLFDSGSSHTFVSQAYARKYEFKINEMKYAYCISSAGADTLSNQVVLGSVLEIEGRTFLVNMIVMQGLGVDVILGMEWMSKWVLCLIHQGY